MINSFLVTLHNDATQPVNGSSQVGDVLWPTPYTPKVYTGPALLANRVLFADETDPLKHFLIAIQLLWVVEESILRNQITTDDSRVSYNRTQLVGQFEGVAGFDPQNITRILSQFSDIPALDFLTPYLSSVYRGALSRMDKLASIIVFFGLRSNGS